jgi:hypothetical protein
VTFKDYPAESYQTVRGAEMMTEAVTLFTRGRAEFWLNGSRRGDRVPGTLSTEHEPVGTDGEFRLVYVERTSRICIPAAINGDKLPKVKKIMLNKDDTIELSNGKRMLVCIGRVNISDRVFAEQDTFEVTAGTKTLTADESTILLDFTEA